MNSLVKFKLTTYYNIKNINQFCCEWLFKFKIRGYTLKKNDIFYCYSVCVTLRFTHFPDFPISIRALYLRLQEGSLKTQGGKERWITTIFILQ